MTPSHTCREIINIENLTKMLKANKVDPDSLTSLKKLKQQLKNSNQHTVKFTLVKNKYSKQPQPGRLYPDKPCSLQNFKKNIRKALANHTYKDIDVVNCHFTLFHQLCKKLDLPTEHIQRYVTDREACLRETNLPRDEAKEAYLKMMYGGAPRKNASDYELSLFYELIDNASVIINLPDHAEFKVLGNEKKGLGSALALLLQDLERKCVMVLVDSLKSSGYEIGTLIHDGFLINFKEKDIDEDDLRSAELALTLEKGYDLVLEEKPLKFDEEEVWGENYIDPENHTEIARDFLKYMETQGHRFFRFNKEYYWYAPENGVYKNDLRQLRLRMNDEYAALNIGATSLQDNLMTQVKALIEDDDEFNMKIVDTTLHYVPFSNGVYDVVQQKLIDYSPDMYFTKRGTIPYEPQSEELKQEVYDNVILGVFGTKEKADFFLATSARAVAGDVVDKRFIEIPGRPNSGKGVLTDAFYRCFQSIYGNYNASNLCEKRVDGDMAKMGSWKVALRNARVCIANEKPKRPIEGESLKMVSGGGDIQTARQNNRDEMDFKLQGTFFLFDNDGCKIDGLEEGVRVRFIILRTAYKYLKKDDYNRYDPDTRPEYIKLAKADIKDVFLKRLDVQQAFAQLVCEAWKDKTPDIPQCVLDETNEVFDDVSEEAIIKSLFIDGCKDDKVTIPQLQAKLLELTKRQQQSADVSNNQLVRKLKDWGYTNSKREMVNSKKVYVFYGIKMMQEQQLELSNNH